MHCTSLIAAQAAKEQARCRLADVPGLLGIGLTRVGDGYAVKVNLQAAVADESLPAELDGVPLVFEVVGAIKRV